MKGDNSRYQLIRQIVFCVVSYFSLSVGITFYNQQVMHVYKFPLSITLTHFIVKFLLAACVRQCLYLYSGQKRVTLCWYLFVTKVAIAGIITSLDISLSNWSLEFITVSLYTMTKSTAIIFLLLFAILFKLEKAHPWLVVIILFIASGILLFTYKATQFHFFGFMLAMGASVLSGMRWTLSQIVLQKKELNLGNPADFIYHMEPWMMVILLPISTAVEGVGVASSELTFGYVEVSVMLHTVIIVMGGAVIAFGLELTEFMLVSLCSSLTLAIVNIVKEITIVMLAVTLKGDHLSEVNTVGLIVCLIGVTLHILWKITKENNKETKNKQFDMTGEQEELVNMLTCEQDEEILEENCRNNLASR